MMVGWFLYKTVKTSRDCFSGKVHLFIQPPREVIEASEVFIIFYGYPDFPVESPKVANLEIHSFSGISCGIWAGDLIRAPGVVVHNPPEKPPTDLFTQYMTPVIWISGHSGALDGKVTLTSLVRRSS